MSFFQHFWYDIVVNIVAQIIGWPFLYIVGVICDRCIRRFPYLSKPKPPEKRIEFFEITYLVGYMLFMNGVLMLMFAIGNRLVHRHGISWHPLLVSTFMFMGYLTLSTLVGWFAVQWINQAKAASPTYVPSYGSLGARRLSAFSQGVLFKFALVVFWIGMLAFGVDYEAFSSVRNTGLVTVLIADGFSFLYILLLD